MISLSSLFHNDHTRKQQQAAGRSQALLARINLSLELTITQMVLLNQLLHAQAEGIPCSLSQEQMVLLSMQEGGVAYNQAFCFALDPALDPELLNKALMALIDRHEPLRAGFAMGPGGLRQTISTSAAECGFQLSTEPMGDMTAEDIAQRAEESTLEKMDLKRAPLMSAKLHQVHF